MADVTYTTVGRVHDAHGIKGELYVSLRETEAPWLASLTHLRLQKPSAAPVELTIVRARPHKHGFIATVKEIQNRNEAETWRGAEFSISSDLLVAKPGESFYLGEILGFEVWAQPSAEGAPTQLGKVTAFTSNGMQDLLNVTLEGSNEVVEIPFVEAFVEDMDSAQRKLTLRIPEEFLNPQFWRG